MKKPGLTGLLLGALVSWTLACSSDQADPAGEPPDPTVEAPTDAGADDGSAPVDGSEPGHGDGGGCAEPLPYRVGALSDVSCAALPLTLEDTMSYERLTAPASYRGGSILAGHYELVKAEVDTQSEARTARAFAFDGAEAFALDAADSTPELSTVRQFFARGRYLLEGTTLTLQPQPTGLECALTAPFEFSFETYSEGCDDYLVMGRTTVEEDSPKEYRLTYRRLRAR